MVFKIKENRLFQVFEIGLDDINYTTLQNYEWILEKIVDNKWGKIRCGKIVKKNTCKEEEFQSEKKKTPLEILDEICKVWYKDEINCHLDSQCIDEVGQVLNAGFEQVLSIIGECDG